MLSKIGRIYRDRGNRWFIQLPGRVRIYCEKNHHTFHSREQAEWCLHQIHAEMAAGTFDEAFYQKTKKSVHSFEVYAESWLKRCERKVELGKISKIHLRHLRHCVNNLFIPFFGSLNMLDIKGRHITEFWLSLNKAPKTVYNIMAALHRLFNDALRDDTIQQLPSFPAELRASELPEPHWRWASEEVQEQIFQHLEAGDLYFILFQACHGTRTGETRALQHGDIDLANDTVTIRRAFSERDLKEHTKSKRIRTIPLDPMWKEIYVSRPRAIDPHGFVFTNGNGKPYSTKWMWRRWCEACDKAGVPGLTLYQGTRHSLASQAANRGCSIYMIARFLGHNDIKTSQRYAHLDTNPMRQVQRRASVSDFSAKCLQMKKDSRKGAK